MKKIFSRKVLINKRTGQPSITLPKKKLMKLFKKVPKEVSIKIEVTKW